MNDKTTRDIDDRLFPSAVWDHGWSLSLQGDKAGYQCSPAERLPHLEDYDTVEGVIYGPFAAPVDISTLEMPAATQEKFTPLGDGNGPSIGQHLTKQDIAAVKEAILKASLNPNAGIPRGRIVWSGVEVFHGTSAEVAGEIVEHGIDMAKSSGGYFGHGFYVADDEALARSNYADFADEDEEAGAVISATIAGEARILDLRNPIDSAEWSKSGLEKLFGQASLPSAAVEKGIDGVYDRSIGGLVIFSPIVLEHLQVIDSLEKTSEVRFDGAPR